MNAEIPQSSCSSQVGFGLTSIEMRNRRYRSALSERIRISATRIHSERGPCGARLAATRCDSLRLGSLASLALHVCLSFPELVGRAILSLVLAAIQDQVLARLILQWEKHAGGEHFLFFSFFEKLRWGPFLFFNQIYIKERLDKYHCKRLRHLYEG